MYCKCYDNWNDCICLKTAGIVGNKIADQSSASTSFAGAGEGEGEVSPEWKMKRQVRRGVPKMEDIFEEFSIFDMLTDDWKQLQTMPNIMDQSGDDKLKVNSLLKSTVLCKTQSLEFMSRPLRLKLGTFA